MGTHFFSRNDLTTSRIPLENMGWDENIYKNVVNYNGVIGGYHDEFH